jgi:hypothetical protein
MREIDVALQQGTDAKHVVAAVDAQGALAGLTTTLKTSLRKYPGCTHWHFKRGKQKGTLEMTYWPNQNKLWFTVRADRQADWMSVTLALLQKSIETELAK